MRKLPTVIAAAVFVVLALSLVLGVCLGTVSGVGWDTFSAICPLGALATMIAGKTFIPRAVVSLVLSLALFLVAGRVFCGYVCPVPLLGKVRGLLANRKKADKAARQRSEELREIAQQEMSRSVGCEKGCASCGAHGRRAGLDTRHAVLLAALGTTAIFGFPVFCLICPIGLTFATVLVVWRLFAFGDVTVSVLVIPLVLIIELVFLRKWCSRFCPLAGLMTLFSRFSKTFVPTIDDGKCLETNTGKPCSKCAEACDAGINLRHLQRGDRTLADCTRCRACVAACPARAVSMPLLPVKRETPMQGGRNDMAQIDESPEELDEGSRI